MTTMIDFFCGAGGFGLGFQRAGFNILAAYDFDKFAVQSYRENVGEHVQQMDILHLKGHEIPSADVWTFGFPCQDISVAGRQAGMIKGQTRSGMFYEIMRLLEEVDEKPKMILAENVKAVKKFIPTIAEEYDKVGYRLVTPQLYNSKYWGVPQNRERYFLLGIRKDLNIDFTFPIQQTEFVPKLSSILETDVPESFYINNLKAIKIIEQAKEGLRVKQATKQGYDVALPGDAININYPSSTTRRGRVGKQIAQTLTTKEEQIVVEPSVHACITPDRVEKRQNGRRAKGNEEEMFTLTAQDRHGIIIAANLNHYGNDQMNRIYSPEGVSPTALVVSGGGRELKVMIAGNLKPDHCTRSGQRDDVWDSKGVAGTVCATDYKQPRPILHDYRVRKLTPTEYARLQGFVPYKQVVSNSQFYKQMGNAVTVPVAEAIANAIKGVL